MEGFIYKITNKVNGKVYIGQTTRTPEERFKEHMWKTPYTDYKFGKAIIKHGRNSFEFEELCRVECGSYMELRCELNRLEEILVKEYNSYDNGYNGTVGGDGCVGTNNRNSEYIKHKMVGVAQYDLEGKLLNTFESLVCAEKFLNKKGAVTNIPKACRGEFGTCYGYQWRFISGSAPTSIGATSRRHSEKKAVDQLSMNGEFIRRYDGIIDASNAVGVSRGMISSVCAGRKKSSAGFKWRFAE